MPADTLHTPTRSDRSVSGISRAEEKRIALALSPSVAWPTLGLAILLPTLFLVIAGLGLTDRAPLWLCTPVLGLVSYAHYTLVHEAVHGNVVSGKTGFGWMNPLVGWIGSVGMGVGWPVLRRTHLLHHSHTNTDKDPDLFVKGSLRRLLLLWVIGSVTALVPLVVLARFEKKGYGQLMGILSPAERVQTTLVTLLTLGLMVAGIATGHFIDWLCLWYLPLRIAHLLLNVFFQWLPHFPFDRTDRYGNTRVSLWLGGQVFTLQQNLHLMHHLWPGVPFYNYARLYRALRPVLVEEGSRIEGLGVGPWTQVKT